MNWSKSIILIIALIGIYVVFLVFSDINKVLTAISNIDQKYLVLGIIPWLLLAVSTSLRWHMFLRMITNKIPFRSSVLYYLAGYAFMLSPGGTGSIIRSPFIKRDYGIPISKTASIVLVERFYDLLGITLVIFTGLIFSNFEKSVIILPAGFAIVIFMIIRNKSLLFKILQRFEKFRIINNMIPNLAESYDVISKLMMPKYFLTGIAVSFVNGLLMVVSVFFLIVGMKASVNFGDLLVIFPASDFAATASFIPGGIGILEGGLLGLLVLYKVKYEIALSITILVRILSTGLFSAIGLLCLHSISKGEPSSKS